MAIGRPAHGVLWPTQAMALCRKDKGPARKEARPLAHRTCSSVERTHEPGTLDTALSAVLSYREEIQCYNRPYNSRI
jgi:hypothetical protein